MKPRFAGPLEIYISPWWDIPWRRESGPARRLSPHQVKKLIRNVENWISYTERTPTEYALEPHECGDLVTKCRNGNTLAADIGDIWPADSHDSYNHFIVRNETLRRTLEEWVEFDRASEARRYATQAAQQSAWETEQRARQEAKEAEAQRQWQIEEERRAEEAKQAAEKDRHRRDELARAEELRRASPLGQLEQQARQFWRDLGSRFHSYLYSRFVLIEVPGECVLPIGARELTFPPGSCFVPEAVAAHMIRKGFATWAKKTVARTG